MTDIPDLLPVDEAVAFAPAIDGGDHPASRKPIPDPMTPTTPSWAWRPARMLLEPLDRRWRHTQAAAATAHHLGPHLRPEDAVALVSAAYLHDIGYVPSIATTGFHPLDGARHLLDRGHTRVAGLVAHHTGAKAEAKLRGLQEQLSAFDDEATIVSAALTYCDLTNGPNGQPMTPEERFVDVENRYGSSSPVVASLRAGSPEMMDAIATIERLRRRHPAPMTDARRHR